MNRKLFVIDVHARIDISKFGGFNVVAFIISLELHVCMSTNTPESLSHSHYKTPQTPPVYE